MNESAVRLEEQIINLFSNVETEIYQGWVLKETAGHTVVYPLYSGSLSRQEIVNRIKACEEISRLKSLNCEFRIVENTNYYLASILEDNGYHLSHCGTMAECCMDEMDFLSGLSWSKESEKLNVILDKKTRGNGIENIVTSSGSLVGIKRRGLLYLPEGELPCDVEIEDVFRFAIGEQVSRIVVNILEDEKWMEYYRESGFHKAYFYRCYQKEE